MRCRLFADFVQNEAMERHPPGQNVRNFNNIRAMPAISALPRVVLCGPMHIATKLRGRRSDTRQCVAPLKLRLKNSRNNLVAGEGSRFLFQTRPMSMLGMLAATGRNSMRWPSRDHGR
jgi:hypothetical protein